MGIVTQTFYAASCDLCGFVDREGDYVFWSSLEDAIEVAVDSDWKLIQGSNGRSFLFCPDMVTHFEWACDTGRACESCGSTEMEELWAGNCEECWCKAIQA